MSDDCSPHHLTDRSSPSEERVQPVPTLLKVIKAKISWPWLAFVLILITTISVERAYSSDLLESGAEFDHDLERNSARSGFTWASRLIFFYYKYAVISLVTVFLSVDAGYKIFMFYQIGDFVNAMLKTSYAQGRPFYYHPSPNDPCSTTMGMPSGHAMQSFVLYVGVGLLCACGIAQGLRLQNSDKRRSIALSCIGFGICVSGITGWARMFGGMHSYIQIILGWMFGLGLLGVLWKLRSHFDLSRFREGNLYWGIRFAIWFVLMAIALCLYPFVSNWKVPQLWVDNMAQRCPDALEYPVNDPGHDQFLWSAFFGTTNIAMIIGTDAGMLALHGVVSSLGNLHKAQAPYRNLYWYHLPGTKARKCALLLVNLAMLMTFCVYSQKALKPWFTDKSSSNVARIYTVLSCANFVFGFLYFTVAVLVANLFYPIILFPQASTRDSLYVVFDEPSEKSVSPTPELSFDQYVFLRVFLLIISGLPKLGANIIVFL